MPAALRQLSTDLLELVICRFGQRDGIELALELLEPLAMLRGQARPRQQPLQTLRRRAVACWRLAGGRRGGVSHCHHSVTILLLDCHARSLAFPRLERRGNRARGWSPRNRRTKEIS